MDTCAWKTDFPQTMSFVALSTKLRNRLTLYIHNLTHGHGVGTISLFGCYVKVTGEQKLLGKKLFSHSSEQIYLLLFFSFLLIKHLLDPPAFNQRCLHLLRLLEKFSLIDTLPLLRPSHTRRWMNKRRLNQNSFYWPWQKKIATQKNKFAKEKFQQETVKVFGRTALTKQE